MLNNEKENFAFLSSSLLPPSNTNSTSKNNSNLQQSTLFNFKTFQLKNQKIDDKDINTRTITRTTNKKQVLKKTNHSSPSTSQTVQTVFQPLTNSHASFNCLKPKLSKKEEKVLKNVSTKTKSSSSQKKTKTKKKKLVKQNHTIQHRKKKPRREIKDTGNKDFNEMGFLSALNKLYCQS